eukprot:COSAG06_NODE_23702_length_683_cov_9.448630_1_plen_184_part_01
MEGTRIALAPPAPPIINRNSAKAAVGSRQQTQTAADSFSQRHKGACSATLGPVLSGVCSDPERRDLPAVPYVVPVWSQVRARCPPGWRRRQLSPNHFSHQLLEHLPNFIPPALLLRKLARAHNRPHPRPRCGFLPPGPPRPSGPPHRRRPLARSLPARSYPSTDMSAAAGAAAGATAGASLECV